MGSDVGDGDVANALREMYAALAEDDDAGLNDVLASDFYTFDNGRRLNGAELSEVVRALHASGRTGEWTVNEPETHVVGDWAWVTYVNRGYFAEDPDVVAATWLESAVLRHDGERWRVQFFHSSRARSETPRGVVSALGRDRSLRSCREADAAGPGVSRQGSSERKL